MDDTPPPELPADLRFLKRLVTVLTATMIAGLVLIVAVIVIRLGPPSGPVLPERIALPDGARALAVTAGEGWFLVVTDDSRALVFGADGALRQTVTLD